MTPFDFVSVFFSVVIGLGVSQLLSSIAQMFEYRRQVVFDWVASLWVFTIFLFLVQAWWGLWSLRTAPSWSYASFLLLVAYQGAIFLLSTLVLPRSYGGGGVSQEAHFNGVRPLFFSALAVVSIAAFLVNSLLFHQPVISGAAILPIAGTVVALSAARIGNRPYQSFVALFFAVGVIFMILADDTVLR